MDYGTAGVVLSSIGESQCCLETIKRVIVKTASREAFTCTLIFSTQCFHYVKEQVGSLISTNPGVYLNI